MRRLIIGLAAALVAQLAAGQEDMSLEDYAALMESNRMAIAEVDAAVDAAAYDDARVHVAVLRRNFQELRRFWSARDHADATGIVRDGLGRLAALEELLGRFGLFQSSGEVPVALVRDAAEEFRSAVCAACHDAYREGDRQTGFRFREGVYQEFE